MIPTAIGMVVIVIGLYLLVSRSTTAMLSFVMMTTLLGGSAAVALPALGGSTIPPANLALVFLALRITLPQPGQWTRLQRGLADNGFLVLFALYGAVTAWILPHMFAGAIEVTPLRPGAVRQLYEASPLNFSSQNITTSVYMLGTLVAGVGTTVAASRPGSALRLAQVGIAIAITHAVLGFLSTVSPGTPLEAIIEFFRNGRYAQLDQSIGGLRRMNGIWPEVSGFAAFGGAWMIFTTELWLRNIHTRSAGLAAGLLACALLISTSSTAYVTLGGYSVVLTLRALLLPGSVPLTKALMLAGCGFAAFLIVLAGITFSPGAFDSFGRVIEIMTVEKTDSQSGMQRLYWATQGLNAFVASSGLGIGAGSFRSSSLITAIIGSMGIIGVTGFTAHLLRVFKPLRAATWRADVSGAAAVGAAASWTALLMLMAAAVASPSPDPGETWAIFAGLALALRSPAMARQSRTTRKADWHGAPPAAAMP